MSSSRSPVRVDTWGSRRYLGLVVLPTACVYVWWLWHMGSGDLWHLFLRDWYMTVTMIGGSFIAGASSEGGGAIAYPVMTLAFEIDPAVARNFSLAIQSVGMTAASLYIIARRIPIETTYLWWVALGGAFGMVAGTYGVAPYVPAAYAKMLFVSFWLAYGIALFVINHLKEENAIRSLGDLSRGERAELVGIGVVGGILSAVLGNGIDICSFAFVTLRYRLSEKIATPTSVILMAGTAVLGTALQAGIGDLQPQAVDFWRVSVPVVVLGAPFGAYVVSKIPRLYIAGLLYAIIGVQFASAVWIIRPDWTLSVFSAGVFAFGLLIFFWLTRRADPVRKVGVS